MGESEASDPSHRGRLWPLAVGAIGVVYGDIGTSPLYTPSSIPVTAGPGPLLLFIQQAQLTLVYAPGSR